MSTNLYVVDDDDSIDEQRNTEQYLEKGEINVYLQDALTQLLENRPEHPLRFLIEYFQASGDKPMSPLSRAYRAIRMTPRNRPAFMNNLVSAFTILETSRNGPRSSGLTGKDLTKLLYLLSNDSPFDAVTPLMSKLNKHDCDLIEFPVFCTAVNTCLLYEDLIAKGEWLFKGFEPEASQIQFSKFAAIVEAMQANQALADRLPFVPIAALDPRSVNQPMSFRDFMHAILKVAHLPI